MPFATSSMLSNSQAFENCSVYVVFRIFTWSPGIIVITYSLHVENKYYITLLLYSVEYFEVYKHSSYTGKYNWSVRCSHQHRLGIIQNNCTFPKLLHVAFKNISYNVVVMKCVVLFNYSGNHIASFIWFMIVRFQRLMKLHKFLIASRNKMRIRT